MKTINDKIFGLDLLRRHRFRTKADLIKYHSKKIQQLESDNSKGDTLLKDIENVNILFDHLYDGRWLELDMASHIEQRDMEDNSAFSFTEPVNLKELLFEDSPVKFNFYDNKYLIIDTPIVFKNAQKYSNERDLLTLANYVCAIRKYYENEHEMSLKGQIKTPYWVIFIRKIPHDNYKNFADSDNIELKKVSNIIAQSLFLSDSPMNKSDCTMTEVVENMEDIGLTIAVMEEQYAVNFLDNFVKYKSLKFLKTN